MKYDKCTLCSFSDIHSIIFHDYLVQKCDKCENVCVSYYDYMQLIEKCMYEKNVGHIRKYLLLSDISKKDRKAIDKFRHYMSFNAFKISSKTGTCNVCHESIHLFRSKLMPSFYEYYCDSCNSVFFNKKEFDKYLDAVVEKINKQNWFVSLIKRFFK